MIYFPFLTVLSLFASYKGGKPPLQITFAPFPSALTRPNRTMINNFQREWPTFPQAYLRLPVFVHSKLPPLEKLHLSPAKGSGLEPLPRPVRERLLPGRPGWRPPGPSADHTVKTSCKRDKMLVRVPKSILSGGEINYQLKLGTCQAKNSSKNFVYFLNGLHQCGTKRQMINGQMIYSNTLQYNPGMRQGPIRRTAPFVIPVSCNYTRYQYSYKVGYLPKMRMRHIFKAMRNRANFILTPRNAQWERLAPLDQYILGDPMYFEAEGPSMPQDMRLYVHSCYATPNKSHTSTPQFPVVKDFGCMIESKYSRSRFIPYKHNVVRFSVDAFYFQGMTDQLYMHCTMSAESNVPTPTAKSCNYDTNLGRWVELHGWDWVCACCDSSCGSSAAALSEVTTSSRGWKVQPRGQLFKNHKRKRLFSSTTTTAPTSIVKTNIELIQRMTTPWPALIVDADDTTELKWPFWGRGVERVENEVENQQVKGTAVMEEEAHQAFEEPKVEAVRKFEMEMLSTTTAPTQKTNTGMTKPDVTDGVRREGGDCL
uniref:Zona pellucida sperm-binding protein 3 n=1 Tax=Hippocampus comes TaxID=109280 RepID=A0A3Q2XZN2_HIPCM